MAKIQFFLSESLFTHKAFDTNFEKVDMKCKAYFGSRSATICKTTCFRNVTVVDVRPPLPSANQRTTLHAARSGSTVMVIWRDENLYLSNEKI